MGFKYSLTFFSLGFYLVICLGLWAWQLRGGCFNLFVCLFSGRYQEKLYADWSQTVSEKSQYNLTQPLIRRDPETKLITVNFDPQVRTSFPVCWWARLQAVPHRAWQVWWDRY